MHADANHSMRQSVRSEYRHAEDALSGVFTSGCRLGVLMSACGATARGFGATQSNLHDPSTLKTRASRARWRTNPRDDSATGQPGVNLRRPQALSGGWQCMHGESRARLR